MKIGSKLSLFRSTFYTVLDLDFCNIGYYTLVLAKPKRNHIQSTMNGWNVCFAFLGLITSIYSCYYVIKKLELNKVIKGLLMGITIRQLVSFFNVSMHLCNIAIIAGLRNKFVCFYSILSGTLLYSGSLIFNSAISWARFYITWKTHHHKYPKTYPIIVGTITVYLLNLVNR